MVEWVKSNPTIYDKSLKGFKNTPDKDAKWSAKSVEMGKDGEYIP